MTALCYDRGEFVAGVPMDQTQELVSTAALLDRVRAGDPKAKERLVAIYLPLLMRWGSGRLPSYARSPAETQDLV